jgi:FkbH-like protein
MSVELYTNLQWLPAAPAEFKAQCAELQVGEGPKGDALRQLAGHSLDVNQLSRLARSAKALREKNVSLAPLTPFRLGLVSNATTDFLEAALVASALRHGLDVELVKADYGQVLQTALDPGSTINRAKCDAVLIALDYRGLSLELQGVGDAAAADAKVDAALALVNSVRGGIHGNSGAVCLLQTIARPVETLFGNADRRIAGTWVQMTEAFNRKLAEGLDGGDALIDVAAIAETVGLANWHDPMQWNLAKIPFALGCVPLYADHVGRVLGALKGKSRRVLVLDLDNTVWSGVIGDDGLEGIVVGQGDATGEAHLELQAAALALRSRGLVLAVSSKNDEDVARLPFQKHPDMLLREEHIAVFQANWKDKATNLTAIAEELTLGIDALAFVDDNPFERNFVRESAPKVGVPEMPEDPALYARTLAAAGLFEALTLSSEDLKRSEFYQDNARRATLQKQVGNLQEYLASLEMELTVLPFDAVGRSRITQLINKSNQFNLTTRRYTEAEVEALENDPDVHGLQIRLRDRFGDNGMISVIVCRRVGEDWEIDTWLMSCRVLGRGVETAVLKELTETARRLGLHRLIGRYIPTERNTMVRDHYATLGFKLLEEKPDGETVWGLDASTIVQETTPMVVRHDA